MLKRLLRSIRRQPKHTRDKIALGLAGGFTAMVFSVWLYNMPNKIATISENDNDEDKTASFSHLFEKVGNQLSSVKDAVMNEDVIEKIEEEIEMETQTPTYTSETVSDGNSASPTATSSDFMFSNETVAASSSEPEPTPVQKTRPIRLVTKSSVSSTTATSSAKSE